VERYRSDPSILLSRPVPSRPVSSRLVTSRHVHWIFFVPFEMDLSQQSILPILPAKNCAYDCFATTPFGVCCRLCRMALTSNEQSLARDIRAKHRSYAVPSGKDLSQFLLQPKSNRHNLVFGQHCLILNYIRCQVLGHVCGSCGEAFLLEGSLRQHCYRRENCHFELGQTTKVYITFCGRVVSDDHWHISSIILTYFGLYRAFFENCR
jgi:hypothetical protein